jgi:hypothetical protein
MERRDTLNDRVGSRTRSAARMVPNDLHVPEI